MLLTIIITPTLCAIIAAILHKPADWAVRLSLLTMFRG
jgi:hypothetical protein